MPHAAPHPRQRPLLALVLRLGSALAFSLLLLTVRLSGDRDLWLPETLMWRQAVPALVIFAWLAARGELHTLRTARPWIHARRAAVGTVGMFMTLGVALLLPLAEATVLGFTSPIFAVLLSLVLLREDVGFWRFVAVLLGLGGVLIITGPSGTHLPLPGTVVGIGAAFMVALVSIQLRDLGRTEQPLTVVFYFSAMSVPMLGFSMVVASFLPAPLGPAHHEAAFHHSMAGWALLMVIGLLGLLTQWLMTAALRLGRVSSVIVMDYSQFGWATLWGWLMFGALPPAATWIGAPAIIAAGLIIAWCEHGRGSRPAS